MGLAFQPGWVVELTCGGPDMTVAKVDGERVTCIWFPMLAGDFAPQPATHTFDAECLQLSPAWLASVEEDDEGYDDEDENEEDEDEEGA